MKNFSIDFACFLSIFSVIFSIFNSFNKTLSVSLVCAATNPSTINDLFNTNSKKDLKKIEKKQLTLFVHVEEICLSLVSSIFSLLDFHLEDI